MGECKSKGSVCWVAPEHSVMRQTSLMGELHSFSLIRTLVMLCNPFTDIKCAAMVQFLVLIHIVATFGLE
jgi:hypothetical protein